MPTNALNMNAFKSRFSVTMEFCYWQSSTGIHEVIFYKMRIIDLLGCNGVGWKYKKKLKVRDRKKFSTNLFAESLSPFFKMVCNNKSVT